MYRNVIILKLNVFYVPGEVTLLCLGPLTNVALALRLDPKFLTKLKNLVVLGGSVEGKYNIQNM
jgi:inosine-uridine nucleoside N-ribohydrolase